MMEILIDRHHNLITHQPLNLKMPYILLQWDSCIILSFRVGCGHNAAYVKNPLSNSQFMLYMTILEL